MERAIESEHAFGRTQLANLGHGYVTTIARLPMAENMYLGPRRETAIRRTNYMQFHRFYVLKSMQQQKESFACLARDEPLCKILEEGFGRGP